MQQIALRYLCAVTEYGSFKIAGITSIVEFYIRSNLRFQARRSGLTTF